MTSPAGSQYKEQYLGDGLYVSFDDFQLYLRAPREGGRDHWVAIEPYVYQALLEYVANLKRNNEQLSTDTSGPT